MEDLETLISLHLNDLVNTIERFHNLKINKDCEDWHWLEKAIKKVINENTIN